MSYGVKPVNFVRAKHKDEDSVQAEQARLRDQETRLKHAGKEVREFYEKLVGESSPWQREASSSLKDDDRCNIKKTTENKKGKKSKNIASLKQSTTKVTTSCKGDGNRVTKSRDRSQAGRDLHHLLRFSQEGNLVEIKKIVKEGNVDLGEADRYGWDALMCAAFGGHLDVVRFFCKLHPSGLRHRNKQGQSVLELAQAAGHEDIVEALNQVDLEQRSDRLHHEARNTEGSSDSQQPIWCRKCESDVKDDVDVHQRSTAHLFSCGQGPQPTHYHLPESNRGFQMMLQDGWNKEKGLGKEGEGLKFPVKTILKRDRECLGSVDTDVKPRITHFKPFDTDAVKRPRRDPKKEKREHVAEKDTKRRLHSKSHRHKAMEIEFRMSFHSQP